MMKSLCLILFVSIPFSALSAERESPIVNNYYFYVDHDYYLAEEQAKRGDVDAQFYLGFAHLKGWRNVQQDHPLALRWLTQAAEQGHSGAQYELGEMYFNGLGVQASNEKAFYWFEKWAEAGAVQVQHELGQKYLMVRNFPKALESHARAGEQGHIESQYIMGEMYLQGHGVQVDEKQAAYWHTKAGEQGHLESQYIMGKMYLEGHGVQADEKQAAYWFTKAAEQGYANAQYQLAYLFFEGLGVEKSYEQAGYWLKKAVAQNHPQARIQLNMMREAGLIEDSVE